MTKVDHRTIVLLLACFVLAGCFLYPNVLNDSNEFLESFVAAPLLSVLGFLTAVTVASASNIHLHLNGLADKTSRSFDGVKSALNKSILTLVFVFILALTIVVVKPVLPTTGYWVACANAMAIISILVDLSIMLDLARTVLKIPPAKDLE